MILPKVAGFIPIVLTVTSNTSTDDSFTFKYQDISADMNQIEDVQMYNHFDMSQKSNYVDLSTKLKFDMLYKQWKNETMLLSSPNQIIHHKNFQDIINLGRPVLKYIGEALDNEPSYLVWALNQIFGFKISNDPTLNISEASSKWVSFLKTEGLYQ